MSASTTWEGMLNNVSAIAATLNLGVVLSTMSCKALRSSEAEEVVLARGKQQDEHFLIVAF